jgi:Uri superfamily endonuclease
MHANPGTTGSYAIALWLLRSRTIAVGRLGAFEFPAGWYLYTGSAFGPGGLQARLARHRRRVGNEGDSSDKRAHWHVDYLREEALWGGAWVSSSGQRLECEWVAALGSLPGAQIVAPGFGSSDCGCPAHLVRLEQSPSDAVIAATLEAERLFMGDEDLHELLQVLVAGDDGGTETMDDREKAALALGRHGQAAIEPLEALLDSDDAGARWWAARALAEVGCDGAAQLLVRALDDVDADVRACAALALGRTGATPELAGAASPALARALADESAFVASIAGDALAMIGEPAVASLVETLADDNSHVRLLAVRALGRIRSQSAIGPLFGLLEDPSYLVRYCVQEALEALGVGLVLLRP